MPSSCRAHPRSGELLDGGFRVDPPGPSARGITPVVRPAAAHLGVAVADLEWGTPFEPAGQALARRLCPAVLYVAW